MKVTPNIGIINALIRITCGLTLLSWSTARLVRRPMRESSMLAAMMGAMKVAEGIVRYCPVTAFLQQQTGGEDENSELLQNLNQMNKS